MKPFEGLAASDTWTFGTAKETEAVPVRSRLVVNTAEAAVDAAVAGLGPTRVHRLCRTATSADRKVVPVQSGPGHHRQKAVLAGEA